MIYLKRYNVGVWFNYPNLQGVKFKIRPVTLKEKMDIRVQTRKKIAVNINDRYEIVDDYDDAQAVWLLFDKALEDWEGIKFEDDNMTIEEKKKIIFEHEELRDFIFQKSNYILEVEERKFEEELKNSKSSESGSPSSQE